jgi:hypothetical protein
MSSLTTAPWNNFFHANTSEFVFEVELATSCVAVVAYGVTATTAAFGS